MRSGVHTDFHLPAVPEAPKASPGLLASTTASTCDGCLGAFRRHCDACHAQAAVVLQAGEHGMSLCRQCEQVILDSRALAVTHGATPEPLVYLAGRPPITAEERAARHAERTAQGLIQRALLVAGAMPSSARHDHCRGHRQPQQRRAVTVTVEAPTLWDREVAPCP
jgi:hypothetical protein